MHKIFELQGGPAMRQLMTGENPERFAGALGLVSGNVVASLGGLAVVRPDSAVVSVFRFLPYNGKYVGLAGTHSFYGRMADALSKSRAKERPVEAQTAHLLMLDGFSYCIENGSIVQARRSVLLPVGRGMRLTIETDDIAHQTAFADMNRAALHDIAAGADDWQESTAGIVGKFLMDAAGVRLLPLTKLSPAA